MFPWSDAGRPARVVSTVTSKAGGTADATTPLVLAPLSLDAAPVVAMTAEAVRVTVAPADGLPDPAELTGASPGLGTGGPNRVWFSAGAWPTPLMFKLSGWTHWHVRSQATEA